MTDGRIPTEGTRGELSPARIVRLRNIGVQIDALNDTLRAQLALLDDDEISVLESVRAKLNSGLNEASLEAVDTVGGFIW